MNFAYTAEQLTFADMVARCIGDLIPAWPHADWSAPGRLARSMATPLGRLGLPGLLVPESVGGSGLRVIDAVPAVIEASRRLAPFPVVDTIVAAQAIATMAPGLAAGVVEGREIAAIAWDQTARLHRRQGSAALSGTLAAVLFADVARWIVVPVATEAKAITGAALIDTGGADVRLSPQPAYDLTTTVCDVLLRDAVPAAIWLSPEGWAECISTATVLHAADIVGAAHACQERSLQHLADREQFGQAIGHNQVLRHLAADDHLRLENCRLALAYAAWSVSVGEEGAAEAVAIAKGYASRAGRVIAENAIQIHGGIGFTWDMPLHVLLRRIVRAGATLGSSMTHFGRLGAALRCT